MAARAATGSGLMRIQSWPASSARTAASPGGSESVMPRMSMASVTTSPRKPSAPRSRSVTIGFD